MKTRIIAVLFVFFIIMFFCFFPGVACASEGGQYLSFPLWTAIFFFLLLLSIAIFPLINSSLWGKRYGYVALALAIPAVYVVACRDVSLLLHVLTEYLSFIILLGALFIVSGGIVVNIRSRGTPVLNCFFLLMGAVLANFMGTTGASMVLIRPLIRANKWRKHVSHIYIFFIFLVSNIGGLLTPLGDPPLFLGFLRGVPFFWTLKLIPFWSLAVLMLLCVFLAMDYYYLKKESPEAWLSDRNHNVPRKRIEIKGLINVPFLLMVLVSLFLPPVMREIAMLVAAGLSVYFTSVVVREENAFTYYPMIEVAVLFAAIFVTMAPVLAILQSRGTYPGLNEPWQFFWITGLLSGLLDNAPTYMVFFTAAQNMTTSVPGAGSLIAGVPEVLLEAISVGAVFMGAMSYIGNGPNFMVKAICQENEIEMPSFFGYIAWSCLVLIPIFILVTIIFFQG